jgi:hypothetical protein
VAAPPSRAKCRTRDAVKQRPRAAAAAGRALVDSSQSERVAEREAESNEWERQGDIGLFSHLGMFYLIRQVWFLSVSLRLCNNLMFDRSRSCYRCCTCSQNLTIGTSTMVLGFVSAPFCLLNTRF